MKKTTLYSDLKTYFLVKPKANTLIDFKSKKDREDYCERILQRINISVKEFSVLNIHRIGIEAPTSFIFNQLMLWDGDSPFWPNQIARVKRVNGNLDKIYIYTFGLEKIEFPLYKKWKINLTPLFLLSSLHIQEIPKPNEADNARYLLYKSSGGYPIGVFCLFVRNSISNRDEYEKSQLFSLVAFDFYGKRNWINSFLINPIWERIHNRVSANILNKMKNIIEQNFFKSQNF